jgi:hypothetical protein
MKDDDGEIARVTHFMKGIARILESRSVPDAHAMWARIQLAEDQRLTERARLPVRLAWMFAKCWFVCCAALTVYLAGPMVGGFFLAIPAYVYIAIAAGGAMVLRARRMFRSGEAESREPTV